MDRKEGKNSQQVQSALTYHVNIYTVHRLYININCVYEYIRGYSHGKYVLVHTDVATFNKYFAKQRIGEKVIYLFINNKQLIRKVRK